MFFIHDQIQILVSAVMCLFIFGVFRVCVERWGAGLPEVVCSWAPLAPNWFSNQAHKGETQQRERERERERERKREKEREREREHAHCNTNEASACHHATASASGASLWCLSSATSSEAPVPCATCYSLALRPECQPECRMIMSLVTVQTAFREGPSDTRAVWCLEAAAAHIGLADGMEKCVWLDSCSHHSLPLLCVRVCSMALVTACVSPSLFAACSACWWGVSPFHDTGVWYCYAGSLPLSCLCRFGHALSSVLALVYPACQFTWNPWMGIRVGEARQPGPPFCPPDLASSPVRIRCIGKQPLLSPRPLRRKVHRMVLHLWGTMCPKLLRLLWILRVKVKVLILLWWTAGHS